MKKSGEKFFCGIMYIYKREDNKKIFAEKFLVFTLYIRERIIKGKKFGERLPIYKRSNTIKIRGRGLTI